MEVRPRVSVTPPAYSSSSSERSNSQTGSRPLQNASANSTGSCSQLNGPSPAGPQRRSATSLTNQDSPIMSLNSGTGAPLRLAHAATLKCPAVSAASTVSPQGAPSARRYLSIG